METLKRQAYRSKMRELGKVLRYQVTLQKMVVIVDDWGNQTEGWVDWQTVWANIQRLWGERYYAARAVGEENTIIFEMRLAPFMDALIHNVADYRVVYDGVAYTIKRADPLPGGAWVKLTCEESGGND